MTACRSPYLYIIYLQNGAVFFQKIPLRYSPSIRLKLLYLLSGAKSITTTVNCKSAFVNRNLTWKQNKI